MLKAVDYDSMDEQGSLINNEQVKIVCSNDSEINSVSIASKPKIINTCIRFNSIKLNELYGRTRT